ncbi:SMU1112c/YaeR family gloxylase I-like metalloprotein [Spirosoma agri]|uniref:VOC family protein n=1 Tax=Spirosoma agri TaxID=1987381 RepID=A0A6M0IH58_9BACT|nr:VOC family protein [Spirosoma agri]NEU67035.1 VOC family protein [Spirosoma agri]
MLNLAAVHHIAIICSDYPTSKHFYTDILGLTILGEVYRHERQSYKLDLALNGQYIIELFSFPSPQKRPSRPEALGLRHLAFAVHDLDAAVAQLNQQGVVTEPIRVDEQTGRRFTFFADPDDLPLELYEA